MLCSRCKKNIATVFLTRMEGGIPVNDGICLKCAKELGIAPVNDLMEKMGIGDEELENITGELMNMFNQNEEDADDEKDTATFPFLENVFASAGMTEENGQNAKEEPKTAEQKEKKGKKKFLDSYCINLNQRVHSGKVDAVIGREQEITRLLQILNRRTKNNPCLIGEPGVGKTAIVEGLAQRIVAGEVPYKLRDKEVFLLDLTSLVSGTQFRGQFESRMKSLIDEVKQAGNIILFIDEVHNIVAAGDAEGAMNAANILKPALSRGEIQIIGATTLNEYRKHIEKDAAMERRFQPIIVEEPSIEDAIQILNGIRHYYEEYHHISVSEEVVCQAVLLSERYITDRYLPDKAIDLLDEAMSGSNLSSSALAKREELKTKLSVIEQEREKCMAIDSPTGYQKMADLKIEECRLSDELDLITQKISKIELTVDDLARAIEVWTKVPASKIKKTDFERLNGLAERLKNRIVGQNNAIEVLTNAIRRNRVGIGAKAKPISMIFAGPTGVGKTELVKVLAADLFDAPEALIRLDMSEFMEKHSVSRIIGAPPGYIGYDESGQLTEKIRRKPYSVVLFDEIEKAHPDFLNILLQILDDGHITDAHGRKVNFENTMIVMTTNLGAVKTSAPVGFNKLSSELNEEKVRKGLEDFLRPEFLNRIDEIVVFAALMEEDFRKIAQINLNDLKRSLLENGVEFTWDAQVADFVAKKSFDVKYGARNLQRVIQRDIENAIANVLITNYETELKNVHAVVADDKVMIIQPMKEHMLIAERSMV